MPGVPQTLPVPPLVNEMTMLNAIRLAAAGSGGGGGGSGDVVGPASAVNNNLAAFDLTTGKIIKDSGMAASSVLVTDYAADAGSTDTYVATLNPAPAALVTGAHYRFMANTANTGVATINFNGLGAKTIVKAAGGITTALADNDIRAGQWVDVVWDGTNMQMQSTLGNSPTVDLASPPTIGNVTPNTGTFTSLTASGEVRFPTPDAKIYFSAGLNSGGYIVNADTVNGSVTLSGGNNAVQIQPSLICTNFYAFQDVAFGPIANNSSLTLRASGTGRIIATVPFRLPGYTVGTLPTGAQFDTAAVTDALAPVSLATVVGGGSVVVKVFYDGTNWIVQ